MSERQVHRSAFVELAKNVERVFDEVPPFNSDEDPDVAVGLRAADVVRRPHERQQAIQPADRFVNTFDLRSRRGRRDAELQIPRGIDSQA